MADEAQDSESPKTETKGLAHDIESQIKGAMRSCVAQFKEQADSLTFEGARRLLEKYLGLETYALDVHKRLVKQYLLECLDGADSDNALKTSGDMGEKSVTREVADSSEGLHSKKDVKDSEDSPVMGLLTRHKTTKAGCEESKASENKEVPSESTIKKAVRKRASYVKANSMKITMAELRRLLEKDLELEEYTLDSHKKFISQQLDDVLQSHEFSEEKPASNLKKDLKKKYDGKASNRVSSEESSDSSDSKDDEEEEEVKPRKKNVPKGKMHNSDVKKRGRPSKETNISSGKRRKAVKTISKENFDAKDGGNVSEDGQSESSEEKPVKKKDISNPAYGKQVEHLKSVIKSCGMSVPPSIYKKVKQVPENKREAHLIKELEEILSKEGLSANPLEKEIKEVRKKKERAKELEGIDMSNIVQSSRRRSTDSFVAPPKPKVPVESNGDDAEDTEKDDNEDGDDDEIDGDDNHEDDDDSQSEEFNQDADEDSD
ncbi:glutamic acid-rich protein-like isoform X1 [Carya illinoinensis]|uniref:DEK-C domain-containing protein n=2 Tax=Carya illinoinensis TaxID=32201 RepID=A0A8T1Q753_CARIL|nr:glutamic acid-rich protein-like isoform X1 [Carya illinoinensis]KAG6650245.1 hypothetical protein CIPAW_06G029200 [Carya illinoinensis]KAG6650246.1 hypothetical protein CIPAW_06G029200 [Carya illinoinensis]KAG6707381.1 hypothetical protein I3842_06G028700 [Carya illinoinensis]